MNMLFVGAAMGGRLASLGALSLKAVAVFSLLSGESWCILVSESRGACEHPGLCLREAGAAFLAALTTDPASGPGTGIERGG